MSVFFSLCPGAYYQGGETVFFTLPEEGMALLASRISVAAPAAPAFPPMIKQKERVRGELRIAVPHLTLDIFPPQYKQQLESTSRSVEVVMR